MIQEIALKQYPQEVIDQLMGVEAGRRTVYEFAAETGERALVFCLSGERLDADAAAVIEERLARDSVPTFIRHGELDADQAFSLAESMRVTNCRCASSSKAESNSSALHG